MKKPRNKTYRPKFVSTNPMSQIFGGLSGANVEHLQRLNIRNHGAMAALVQGRGAGNEWDLLVGAINMGNVMCEMGFGDEFLPAILAGRDALLEMGKRAMHGGRFLFKGDELAAMNEALACHDAQLENIRAIDVERASDEGERRIRHGLNTTNVRKQVEMEAA